MVLLLFFTDGTTCAVGALYFRFTGASGFFAVVPDEELKSLLKLEDEGKERDDTQTHMRTQAAAGVRGQRLTVMGFWGHVPNICQALPNPTDPVQP